PRYDGAGRLTVLGIAASPEERSAALDALRSQLPGMTVVGNDILLAPTVADTLSNALTDAGLGGIALTWRDNKLEAGAGGLDDIQLAELETVLAQFNSRHFGVATLATASRQYADTVPFRIRSVVGGPAPFIVLEDGSKLLVGGTYKRYRLTAIEDKRLLFDGPRSAIVLR
ncbi:MAG: type III secretion system inner membrane ring subunit SctD, partial [Burkholderiaceae bacterium]|nr:type III secretion system inner membrane ring subunit SctD [Burkholderiaceae bacterium]